MEMPLGVVGKHPDCFSLSSPEMEFLIDISGKKLKSSQTRVFVWFSIPIFPFYNVLLEYSCFVDFFLYEFLKSEESTAYCENQPVEGTVLQIALSTLMY
jgi:hypothetical protein